jgi:two-component system OmpR family response regulator
MAQGPILVVDDDPHLREVVRVALELAGHRVVEAADGRAGLAAARRESPSLVVLDIMMPELDGLEVCKALRKESQVPIVFLSSRDDELDRVLGLELGGDDYLSKPFSPRELTARVKAVLRRLAPREEKPQAAEAPLRRGALEIDRDTWRCSWAGTPVVLTVMELELLSALAQAPTKVFSRDELIERAYDGVVVSDRTVDSHIRRIRQKFAQVGGTVIETVHGVGYRLGL